MEDASAAGMPVVSYQIALNNMADAFPLNRSEVELAARVTTICNANTTVVTIAGNSRAFPLMIEFARIISGSVVGCDDTSLERERKAIKDAMDSFPNRQDKLHWANDQFCRTSALKPLCGPFFMEGRVILVAAPMDSLSRKSQKNVVRQCTRSVLASLLVVSLEAGPRHLSGDEIIDLLNSDPLSTGLWNLSKTSGSGSPENSPKVLVFSKLKGLTTKTMNPTRFSARLGSRPILVEASTIEKQGAGLPDRIRKIPMPPLMLMRSEAVTKLNGNPQLGVFAAEDMKKGTYATEFSGRIFHDRDEALALLAELKVKIYLS